MEMKEFKEKINTGVNKMTIGESMTSLFFTVFILIFLFIVISVLLMTFVFNSFVELQSSDISGFQFNGFSFDRFKDQYDLNTFKLVNMKLIVLIVFTNIIVFILAVATQLKIMKSDRLKIKEKFKENKKKAFNVS